MLATFRVVGIFVVVGVIGGAWTTAMGGVQINDIAKQHFTVDQSVMPTDDGFDGQRAFTDTADHHVAAGFDPFSDGNFAFA